ncbi:hypothetical protein CFC21_107636 [Triticum aestivum]|uniref:RING-type domain-containing protein n=2 Tax=Triticum aestivum TaxID=4565 RepID=A0A3B6TA66_WHEAT|nr:hypothetical protein CFC21_107636 [Triticum aestivum]
MQSRDSLMASPAMAMDIAADDLFYRALQSLDEGLAQGIAQDGADNMHLLRQQQQQQAYADALFRELTGVAFNSDLAMADTDGPDAPDDPALGEAVAEALKTVGAPSDGQGCPICMEDDDDDNAATGAWKETPCGHRFHGRCVERWLRVKGSCPMCRRQMVAMPAAAATSTSPAGFSDFEMAVAGIEDAIMEFMREGASYDRS